MGPQPQYLHLFLYGLCLSAPNALETFIPCTCVKCSFLFLFSPRRSTSKWAQCAEIKEQPYRLSLPLSAVVSQWCTCAHVSSMSYSGTHHSSCQDVPLCKTWIIRGQVVPAKKRKIIRGGGTSRGERGVGRAVPSPHPPETPLFYTHATFCCRAWWMVVRSVPSGARVTSSISPLAMQA